MTLAKVNGVSLGLRTYNIITAIALAMQNMKLLSTRGLQLASINNIFNQVNV